MSDTIRKAAVVSTVLLSGVLLHGCASGGGGTTTTQTTSTRTTTKTTSTTTSITTTVTTSTVSFEVDSPCVVEGDIGRCVKYLNDQYMGYNPDSEASPVGVTIRGQAHYGDKWFWCGGACHSGQPDCYTAASLLNHRVMLTNGKSATMPMRYPVGFIFQPKAVAEHLAKCSYQFDGSAFSKTNGGCGRAPPGAGHCDNNMSAFYNLCPETGKPIHEDYSCPTVVNDDCTHRMTNYPETCYWKGAAFYSCASPGPSLHPPNLTTGNDHGLREMLKQRLKNQHGTTHDGIPLLQYWNEVTMDGKVLLAMLSWSPKAAVAGIMYDIHNNQAKGFANQFNEQFQKDWGVKVPIIGFDPNHDVTTGSGPFVSSRESLDEIVV